MEFRKLIPAVLILMICSAANAADRKYLAHAHPANTPALPFSDAVMVGDTLYIAGHIGLDPKTGQAPADVEQEAHLVMDGIKHTVEAAGFSMDEVVSLQVYCTDLKYYDTFNAVYQTYFHGDFPARAFLGIDKLLRNGKFEVTGIAIKKTK